MCGCRLLPSASWVAHTRARRIIGQWRELSEACLDGVRSAAQEVRHVWGPTMAQGERFDGRKAAAVLCRAALVVLPHQRCDVRSVVRLKVKRHAGSSRSQVLPAMGGADHEVFMNRNRNARAHALGIYFGAMPYHTCSRSRRPAESPGGGRHALSPPDGLPLAYPVSCARARRFAGCAALRAAAALFPPLRVLMSCRSPRVHPQTITARRRGGAAMT